MSVNEFCKSLLLELKERGNPHRAEQMEAYMRHQFIFFGVMSAERSELLKKLRSNGLDMLSGAEKRELVKRLWQEEARECQLLALEWMLKWNPKEYVEQDLDFFEHLILNKSWWDTVDGIAPNLVGKFAKRFPEIARSNFECWEKHESLWLRRACLIFQLRYRMDTDLPKLQHWISLFKFDKEFFIQKAIGWSLREVSKWNSEWVKKIVVEEQLQGLARREALKYT